MQYTVFELKGRQYLIKPGQTIEVDKLEENIKNIVSDKVMLSVDGSNVKIGTPYLKEPVNLEVLETFKKAKIRVATYKAKANYRRVIGQRVEKTRIKMADSKPEKVEKKVVKK